MPLGISCSEFVPGVGLVLTRMGLDVGAKPVIWRRHPARPREKFAVNSLGVLRPTWLSLLNTTTMGPLRAFVVSQHTSEPYSNHLALTSQHRIARLNTVVL